MDNTKPAAQLIVYGHDACPQSRALALALKHHQIAHEWRDVMLGDPRYRVELAKLARGYQSVPTVVFPDGTTLVEPWPGDVLRRLGIRQTGLIERVRNGLRSEAGACSVHDSRSCAVGAEAANNQEAET
ncbi:MAG: glutaredoxin [Chloroflexi bacterium]|nr:glutaredoxin [Chloroflexota bacterium]